MVVTTVREELRAKVMEFLDDLSEDANCTSWYPDIDLHAWRVSEGLGIGRIGVHEPFDWQLEAIADFKRELGEWPTLAKGYYPESDGSNVMWLPLARYAEHFGAWMAERERVAKERTDRLRALPIEDADLDALGRVVQAGDSGRADLRVREMHSVAKLEAHGLLRSVGFAFWNVEATDEGRDLVAGGAPRP